MYVFSADIVIEKLGKLEIIFARITCNICICKKMDVRYRKAHAYKLNYYERKKSLYSLTGLMFFVYGSKESIKEP
jgi:hypothetical protein